MPRADNGTRQKLIDTATDLLWTSSYGSVSVDDMCRAAGVKKGSFYHYFPSKQELAICAMEEYYLSEIKPDMDRIFAANIPFVEQLDALAEAILEEQRATQEKYGMVCGCPLAALGSEMVGQEEKGIHEKMEEKFDCCKSYMHKAIAAAIDTKVIPKMDIEAKTNELHDFITGQMMMARVHNSLDGMERDLKSGMMRLLGLENTHFKQKQN